ncbi:hypothetical protein HYH03_016374 [Edaphochlamys debaryana]|uniref:DUF2252 domain-containing protein n=1 Tax=Edaphochlamys debaryana TaxID=47281 RepID=A0A835XIW1_9CHLO|nr:hypothetical protein HYH03_016374 [Edaphochlamys debaryana]|eukprot:KAG2484893.1 hypothetical protein HYH03_016374 [Edaphochlamys debaryana]
MLSQRRAMPGVRPSRRHSCRPMAWLSNQSTDVTYAVVGGKADPQLLTSNPTMAQTIAALTASRPRDNQELFGQMLDGISLEDKRQKLKKMSAGPFHFYRGSAKFFYRDMQQQNVMVNNPFDVAGAKTWLTGDMHMANASFVGSYLYDVYRLAASVALVARDESNKTLEAPEDAASKYVLTFARSYLQQIEALAADANKDSVNRKPLNKDSAYGLIHDKLLKDPLDSDLGANDEYVKGDKLDKLRAPKDDPYSLQSVDKNVEDAVRDAVDAYARTTVKWADPDDRKGSKYFEVLDVMQRFDQGTGSLGTTRFYVLVAGSKKKPPVLLDVKQQGPPAWYDYVSDGEKAAAYGDLPYVDERDAARVVRAYKKMVSYGPDPHFGVLTLSGLGKPWDGFYSVRERSRWKKSLKLVWELPKPGKEEKHDPLNDEDLELLAEQYGTLLANAHDRASSQSYLGEDGTADNFAKSLRDGLQGKEEAFIKSVVSVGCAYARQVQDSG